MDIKKVIKLISEASGKTVKEIEGNYDNEFERKNTEFEKIGIPKEQIEQMAFIEVGKTFGMEKADVTAIFTIVEIEDDISDEITTVIKKSKEVNNMDTDIPVSQPSFKDFVGKLNREESETQYKKRPSLIVQDGARYKMKLLDAEKVPFEYDNGEYTSYVFDIELISVEPNYQYDEVYEKGDRKGEKLYENGKEYSLWLWEKPFWSFVDFWETNTEDGNPDTREFVYYKKSKGNSKDFIFKEA